MPAWLVAALLKYVLPLVIAWLRKEGFIDAAEAICIKGAVAVVQEVKDLKTYPEYPTGRNGT